MKWWFFIFPLDLVSSPNKLAWKVLIDGCWLGVSFHNGTVASEYGSYHEETSGLKTQNFFQTVLPFWVWNATSPSPLRLLPLAALTCVSSLQQSAFPHSHTGARSLLEILKGLFLVLPEAVEASEAVCISVWKFGFGNSSGIWISDRVLWSCH